MRSLAEAGQLRAEMKYHVTESLKDLNGNVHTHRHFVTLAG